MVWKGVTRAAAIWHRRAGKDLTALSITRDKMSQRIGTYFHCLPSYNQGRKILWDGMDSQGRPFLDIFPPEMRVKTNSSEMKIEMINGCKWQIIGADNFDSVVGTNPIGIVFSEWAISERYPLAWDYFRPMLIENGGWALFIYTPRGRNHGWQLYNTALHSDEWFAEILTVDDTGVVSPQDIERERRDGLSEDMIQQEFYCSFLASTANILIPYTYIEDASKRTASYDKSIRLAGLDVARFGDDRTALVVRQGGLITYIKTWQGATLTETASTVRQAYIDRQFDAVAVDAIGLGAGVADLLNAWGIPTVAINVSENAAMDDRCYRLRDQLWVTMRDWFIEGKCVINLMNREVQQLITEIQDTMYDYMPSGRLKVEVKADQKERLKISPDIADAFVLTFAPQLKWLKIERQAQLNPLIAETLPKERNGNYNPLRRT